MAEGSRKPSRRPPKRDVLDRGAGFIQTSRLVAFDPRLTDRGVRVYMAITDHCWEGRTMAFPSQRSIAGKMSCSIDKVQDGINELRARGLLFISRFGLPARNHYHFIRPDLVYSPEEMAFMAERSHTAEEWENRPVSEPKPYDPPEETDDPDEGYVVEDRKSNEVPDAADWRHLDAGHERHLDAAQDRPEVDQYLSLRERSKKTNEKKESAAPTLSVLPERKKLPTDTSTLDSLDSARSSKKVPRRERTYTTGCGDESYGVSPSGVHEGFADEAASPARVRRRAPQSVQVPSPMPDYGTPTAPLPVTVTPKDEKDSAQDEALTKLYTDWRTEVVARFKDSANDIALKCPRKDFKLRSCMTALLEKYSEPTADGRPGYEVVLRMIRVAAWDWEAIKVHEGAKWVAKGSPYPTLREIHLLSDFLVGHTMSGVTSAPDHRVSNYQQKFLVQKAPEAVEDDPIDRVAKLENKTKAAVIREIRAGRVLG